MTVDDAIGKAAQAMNARLEAEIFGGTSTTAASEETTLDAAKLIKSWEQFLRNARRHQVTFVVDLAHPGPPLRLETPHEGVRFEVSWVQANGLHQQWPLKLWKVLSPEAAEFVPVTPGFGEWVPSILPMPPYEMPEEEPAAL